MATMMRGMSLREAMIRPAMSYSRRLAPRKRALCSTSTTKTTLSVVAPPSGAATTDIDATTEEGNPKGVGPSVRNRMEWRPSEVHRASATSLRRKEAEKTRPKPAGVSARVASAGEGDIRSPGLRRRELLGGIEDAMPQTESALATPARVRPTLQTEATTGERSAVSSSATEKFRRRRELDRLAAAGNAEAQESLRSLGPTSSFSRVNPATSSDGKGTTEGGDGDQSNRGSMGLTPLTVLPLIIALIATGYFAVSDKLPPSGHGGTARVSRRRDSRVARSEGYREYALDEGEGVGKKGVVVERERKKLDDSLRWQRRRPSSPASSPLSKTLSRASDNTAAAAENAAAATATVSNDALAGEWRNGKAWLGKKKADQGKSQTVSVPGTDDARKNGGGSYWGWWGPEGAPQVGGEGGKIRGKDPGAGVLLVGAGEGTGTGGGAGDGKGPQREEAGKRPLWLQKWRAPASSRSS